MRKRIEHIGLIAICSISALLILTALTISIFESLQSKRTTYELPPELCLGLFGKYPDEFFETTYPMYDSCEDFRTYAEVSREGNLVLRLTEEQEIVALQYADAGIEEFATVPGVEIADDYTSFTITGNEDSIADIVFTKYPVWTAHDMAFRQLFSGKDPETISVTCTVVEENTKEVLYTATWPQESIDLSIEGGKFIP